MRIHYLLLLLIALILGSCKVTKHQIGTFESKDVNESFVYSNEDLSIEYDFWYSGGILNFTIRNKTAEPIFVDWEHSNFIFNGYSYDYFSGRKTITSLGVYEGRSISSLVDLDHSIYSVSPGSESNTEGVTQSRSTVRREKKSAQIPPQSYIQAEIVPMEFPWLGLDEEKIQFNKSNSILNVRTYIGYSKDKDLEELTYIDNEFWIESVEEVKDPENHQASNKFYTSNKKVDILLTTAAIVSPILLVLIVA